jgi:hypothetical protein
MGNSFAAGSAPALLGETHDPCFKWKIHDFSVLPMGDLPINCAPFIFSGYRWYVSSFAHVPIRHHSYFSYYYDLQTSLQKKEL